MDNTLTMQQFQALAKMKLNQTMVELHQALELVQPTQPKGKKAAKKQTTKAIIHSNFHK